MRQWRRTKGRLTPSLGKRGGLNCTVVSGGPEPFQVFLSMEMQVVRKKGTNGVKEKAEMNGRSSGRKKRVCHDPTVYQGIPLVNLAECEIRSVLFGPHGRVEEWNLTPGINNIWHHQNSINSTGRHCQIVVVTNENASRHSNDCILVYITNEGSECIYRQIRGKIGAE